jgi:membrane fusion protein (multidrug efflux system)
VSESNAPSEDATAPQGEAVRRLAIPVVSVATAIAVIVTATLQWDRWIGNFAIQTTDDAYVQADISLLSSRVSGAVRKVAVDDFQSVQAGTLLIQIDPNDYLAQVAQATAAESAAKAALDNLSNQIDLQNATIAQAEAQKASAVALQIEAEQEQQRQQELMNTQSGTLQKLQQAVAANGKAQADVKASTAAITAQRQELAVLAGTKQQRAADLQGAQAALQAANLRLGYTTVTAPFDGTASRRQVQVGDYVNVGSNLISIVPLPQVFVIANFKETQLRRVLPGQRVTIDVDTFAGDTLEGEVERISPASGSQFALLPPDNATGNFTKVVQRIPVRIKFEPGQALLSRLLPGMSVTARIHVDQLAMKRDGAK